MPVLTMSPTLGDLLKFELNGSYCRETVTLKSGTNYALGAVLGRITATGKYRLSPAAQVVGDEGAEVATAILIGAVDTTGGDKTGLVAAVTLRYLEELRSALARSSKEMQARLGL